MSSSPKTSTTTSQTQTNPWATAAPYYGNLYQQGANAVAQNQSTPTPQQYVAGANPTELSAVNQTLTQAPNLGQSGNALSDMATKVASGYFTNPANDPNFQGAVSAALTPITRNLTQNILPSNIGNAIKLGGAGGAGPSAYGGGNLALDTQKILQDYTTNATNMAGTMAENAYQGGLNLIPQAGGIANAANTQLLAPATATGAAGTALQGYAQQDINNLLQKYQTTLQAPWNGLQPFANLLTTGGFNTGTATGTSTTPPPDIATQILQGLTGGAGMVQGLFGAGPGGAPSAASNFGSTLGSLFTGAGNLIGNMGVPGIGAMLAL